MTSITKLNQSETETKLKEILASGKPLTNWTLYIYETNTIHVPYTRSANTGYQDTTYTEIVHGKITNIDAAGNSIFVKINNQDYHIDHYHSYSLQYDEPVGWGKWFGIAGTIRRKHTKRRQSKTYKQKRSHKNKKHKKYRH